MIPMRAAALGAALAAGLAPAAQAGGFAPAAPIADPVVVVEPEAPRSSFGLILPLVLLGGLVALAVASSSDDDDDEEEEPVDGGDGGGDGGSVTGSLGDDVLAPETAFG